MNAIRTSRSGALLIKVAELRKNNVWLKFKGLSRPSDVTYLLETAVTLRISHLLHRHHNSMILSVPGAFHHLEISLLDKHYKKLEYNWLLVDPAKVSATGQISSDGINKFLYRLVVHSGTVEYHISETFAQALESPSLAKYSWKKKCISKPLSWNQAFNYCVSIGEYLPEFKSSKEQEQLTTTLKSLEAFSFEAIYIGLKRT